MARYSDMNETQRIDFIFTLCKEKYRLQQSTAKEREIEAILQKVNPTLEYDGKHYRLSQNDYRQLSFYLDAKGF